MSEVNIFNDIFTNKSKKIIFSLLVDQYKKTVKNLEQELIKFEMENYNRNILIHLNAQINNKDIIKVDTLFKIIRRVKLR